MFTDDGNVRDSLTNCPQDAKGILVSDSEKGTDVGVDTVVPRMIVWEPGTPVWTVSREGD